MLGRIAAVPPCDIRGTVGGEGYTVGELFAPSCVSIVRTTGPSKDELSWECKLTIRVQHRLIKLSLAAINMNPSLPVF